MDLEISPQGESVLKTSYEATQQQLQGILERLNAQEQESILSSMRILRVLFTDQAKDNS